MLKYISIYLAGVLLVLHVLIPHQHSLRISAQTCSVQNEQPQGFLDWIKQMIHKDLGAEHLEHFGSVSTDVEQKAFDLCLAYAIITGFFASPLSPERSLEQKGPPGIHWPLPLSPSKSSFALRGPPTLA